MKTSLSGRLGIAETRVAFLENRMIDFIGEPKTDDDVLERTARATDITANEKILLAYILPKCEVPYPRSID